MNRLNKFTTLILAFLISTSTGIGQSQASSSSTIPGGNISPYTIDDIPAFTHKKLEKNLALTYSSLFGVSVSYADIEYRLNDVVDSIGVYTGLNHVGQLFTLHVDELTPLDNSSLLQTNPAAFLAAQSTLFESAQVVGQLSTSMADIPIAGHAIRFLSPTEGFVSAFLPLGDPNAYNLSNVTSSSPNPVSAAASNAEQILEDIDVFSGTRAGNIFNFLLCFQFDIKIPNDGSDCLDCITEFHDAKINAQKGYKQDIEEATNKYNNDLNDARSERDQKIDDINGKMALDQTSGAFLGFGWTLLAGGPVTLTGFALGYSFNMANLAWNTYQWKKEINQANSKYESDKSQAKSNFETRRTEAATRLQRKLDEAKEAYDECMEDCDTDDCLLNLCFWVNVSHSDSNGFSFQGGWFEQLICD